MEDRIISFPGLFGSMLKLDFKNYFEIFGGFRIYWYGVLITLGFVLGVTYMYFRSKKFGIKNDDVIDLLLLVVPAAIIGARLFFCIFEFKLYNDGTVLGTLRGMVNVRDGGLSIFGGIIASIAVIIPFCKKKGIRLGAMLDLAAFGLLIGQIIGRWGNFCNREAYGTSPYVHMFPLRMGLTTESGSAIFVHPCFLYESVWNLIGLVILHFFSRKHRKYDGQIALMYFVWYGLGRFMIEGMRTDALLIGGTEIRISRLIAFAMFAFGAVALAVIRNRKLYDGVRLQADMALDAQSEAEADDQQAE